VLVARLSQMIPGARVAPSTLSHAASKLISQICLSHNILAAYIYFAHNTGRKSRDAGGKGNAMNLVSTIMQLLGPAIISRIAASLGVNQGFVGKAISAAIPAILAGLTKTASQGSGATQLANAIAKQDPSILGNLGNLIGGAGEKSLVDSGKNILTSLLGGSSTNALAGALGKFAGLSGTQGSSLLGMLAPVVLGQLGQVQKSSGLDAGGLANLLNSQKGNIAAALPSGFSDLLGGTGLLDALGDKVKAGAAPAQRAAGDSASLLKWLVPAVLAALALVLVSNYGCERKTAEKVETPAVPPAATVPAQNPPMAAGVNYVDIASKALSGLTTALGGVKDETTANAAVPGLQDIAKQIDSVKAAALTGDAKKSVASLVAAALPGITAAIEKAVGIPGVAAILNPILQPLVANLNDLSKT